MNTKAFLITAFLCITALACGLAAPATPSDRCVPASALQMENVRQGIKQVDANNDALQGFAVQSGDHESLWFVAAPITGPGLDSLKPIGLWAMSGELDSPTAVFSVDGMAQQFSNWSDGTQAEPELSMSDDGAQEALSCAKQ